MSQHIRFESSTGKMITQTVFGKYTEELLQLNDPTQITFRNTTLQVLKLASKELALLKSQAIAVEKAFKDGKISQLDHDTALQEIGAEIQSSELIIQSHSGTEALPPLIKQRFGVVLS